MDALGPGGTNPPPQGVLWWLRVDRHRRQLMQRVWRPGVLEHLWSRQRRSLVRLQVQRWCMVEAVSRRLWLRLGKRCVRREDRHMLRLRLRLRRSRRRIRGIVDTTRAARWRVRRVRVVVVGLWCTMQRVWVRPRLQREARRVRQVRRLAGKHCEVERARRTLRRQLVWLQERRW